MKMEILTISLNVHIPVAIAMSLQENIATILEMKVAEILQEILANQNDFKLFGMKSAFAEVAPCKGENPDCCGESAC